MPDAGHNNTWYIGSGYQVVHNTNPSPAMVCIISQERSRAHHFWPRIIDEMSMSAIMTLIDRKSLENHLHGVKKFFFDCDYGTWLAGQKRQAHRRSSKS